MTFTNERPLITTNAVVCECCPEGRAVRGEQAGLKSTPDEVRGVTDILRKYRSVRVGFLIKTSKKGSISSRWVSIVNCTDG